MKIPVFIDSCAWDYLYDNRVNLDYELSSDKYQICQTKEILIEINAMPDFRKDGFDNREKKVYINKYLHRVHNVCVFGFRTMDSNGEPAKAQVYGGFGQGTFQSADAREYYSSKDVKRYVFGKKRKDGTGLGDNQADASLAEKSRNAIVLTAEKPEKPGPLKDASMRGWYVVYLRKKEVGISIDQFISISVDLARWGD
jgi:hypothetical protein